LFRQRYRYAGHASHANAIVSPDTPAFEKTPVPIGGANPRPRITRVTPPSPYDETARRMLAREATGSDTQEAQIAAAERVLGRLQEHLLRWFGPDGFHAVLSRALATARKAHPALAHVRIEQRGEWRLAELAASAHKYHPADFRDALLALVAATLALLSRLIGDDLVRRLLQQAWPPEPPNDTEADTRPGDTRMTERE
jgi:hypothetical protein